MNFFDTFEVARSATPTTDTTPSSERSQGGTTPQQQQELTLNEELNQVVGQLGGLWGRLRQQSAIALEIAKKDLGSVVTQAQHELGKLTAEPSASSSTSTTSPRTSSDQHEQVNTEEKSTKGDESTSSEPLTTDKEDGTRSTSPTPTAATTSPFQTFLSRVQATVPPNIAATIQTSIPESIRHSTSNFPADFAHVRSTIASELQRIEGITRAQAEEYVHKSEALLKEAGEFLKDAVKIVPPDDADGRGGANVANVMWDGSDVWLIPSMASSSSEDATGGDFKGKARQVPTYSRAEALLQRLKRDPEVIRVDPAAVVQTTDMFDVWFSKHVSSKEGGIDGTEWFERIKATLEEGEEGQVLMNTRDSLVPSSMDSQTFWTRYFFRVYQIEKDEEKRKALLEAQTGESEEDFNWEDEEDEDVPTPPVAPAAVQPTESKISTPSAPKELSRSHRASVDTLVKPATQPEPMSTPTSLVSTPANASPRESSESSYDVVSTGSARASAGAKSPVKDVEDDGDSDWE